MKNIEKLMKNIEKHMKNIEKPIKNVLYLCDKKRCHPCSCECEHTSDISHAKNFILIGDSYFEQSEVSDGKC